MPCAATLPRSQSSSPAQNVEPTSTIGIFLPLPVWISVSASLSSSSVPKPPGMTT